MPALFFPALVLEGRAEASAGWAPPAPRFQLS